MRAILILTASCAILTSVNISAAEPAANPNPGPQVRPQAQAQGAGFGSGIVNGGEGVVIRAGGGNPGTAPGRGVGKSASEFYIESINRVVPLSPEQQNTMMKIIEARDKAVKDFQTANADKFKAANQAMMDAYKTKDQAAIAKAQKENQALYAGTSEIYSKAQKDLDAVLTPEQKTKRQEARVTQVMKSLTDGATLTPEQEAKIKAVLAESGGGESRERASYQAVQDVLTAEQKAAISKNRVLSMTKMMFAHVNLTADQLKQLDTAYDEIVKSGATPEEVRKKLNDAVNGFLTAEQKEKTKGAFATGRAGGAAPGAPLGSPQILKTEPRK